MSTCRFCLHDLGGHDPACPNATKDEKIKRTREALYHLGWKAGRSRGNHPNSLSPNNCFGMNFSKNSTFNMGVNNGNVALEEAENGWNPMDDGGQW